MHNFRAIIYCQKYKEKINGGFYMIILNRENFKTMMDVALTYEESMHAGNYSVSSSDMKREITARNDVDKMLFLLVKKGVNIEKELIELAKKYGMTLENGEDFVEKNENFEIKFKSHLFDRYLERKHPELLLKDELIIENKEFCKDMDIGDSRFTYQLWDVTDEAIEYLKSNCSVFASASEILDKAANYYSTDSKIKDIQCIRDGSTNPNVNCSQYLVYLENSNEYHIDKTTVLIQAGGFDKDAILLNNGRVEYILPLEKADKWSIRRYSPNMDDIAKKYINMFAEHKNKILNNK